jgi:hypothetical protein
MFRDFKQTMIKEFDMTDIGISYYLGIEIKKGDDEIFVNQEKFAMEVVTLSNYNVMKSPNISLQMSSIG